MTLATSGWHQQPWPHGINFYGFRVKPTDKPFTELARIIETAADKIAASHNTTGSGIVADSGLDLADRLHTFNGNLLDQLRTSSAPHALDFSGIADGNALADQLGFLFPHANLLSIAESARSTHVCLVSQQWGTSEAWLDANFTSLVTYLGQLVQGTFIDRNGTKLAFSLNSNQLGQELPQIATNLAADSPQIAGELIYSLVEFLGDREFQVPCYDPSSGQTHYTSYTCYKANVITQVIGPNAIWTYTDANGVSQDQYQVAGALIAYASKAFEAAVKSNTGTLVRGVTVLGLDNEAIAEIIATALAVAAKKLMEAFTREVLVAFIADATIEPNFKDAVFKSAQTMLNLA